MYYDASMRGVAAAEVTVQKQRGKWTVRQSGYDPASGRRRVRQLGTFATRKAAEEFSRSLFEGRIGSSRETVGDYVREVWLRSIEGRVADNTHEQYRWAVDNHIVPLLGSVRLKDLTPEIVDDWITALSVAAPGDRPRLSATSTRLVRKILSMALENAVQRGSLKRNAVVLTRPPRARRTSGKQQGWTLAEARSFLEATKGHRLYPAFHLGLVTGLRRGELLGLNWGDIDPVAGVVQVQRQYVVVRGRPELRDPLKTESSDRLVTIGSTTSAMLEAYRKRQAAELSLLGIAEQDGALFTTEEGDRVNPNTLGRVMKRLCDEVGVAPLTPKGLRHTAQSVGRVAVGDDKVMQERLGHADIGVTLNTYTHTVTQQHRQAGERIDEVFHGEP